MQSPSVERPSNDEAVTALNRVLSSEVFEAAGRAREFLAFIVQETLAGRGDRLKGYSIAVQVFERPSDFDAPPSVNERTSRFMTLSVGASSTSSG